MLLKILFIVRIVIYYSALAFPLFQPGVVVGYDRYGLFLWFLLLPGEALIAFIVPEWSEKKSRTLLLALLFLLLTTLLSGYFPVEPLTLIVALCSLLPFVVVKRSGASNTAALIISLLLFLGTLSIFLFSMAVLRYLFLGTIAFLLTYGVYHFKLRGLIIIETLFIGSIYYRLLDFSRGMEHVEDSERMTFLLFFLTIVLFIFHTYLLFTVVSTNEDERISTILRRGRHEIITGGVAAILLLLISMAIPPDYVRNAITKNNLIFQNDPVKDGKPGEDGNSTEGQEPGLSFVPADQWEGNTRPMEGRAGEGGSQYAIMVVDTAANSVYLAENYRSRLHPEEGFLSEEFLLNHLPDQQIIQTWKNPVVPTNRDYYRYPLDIAVFSTLPTRFLAYLPESIEPTIINNSTYPFSYSYNAVTLSNFLTIEELFSGSFFEKRNSNDEANQYNAFPITGSQRRRLENFVDSLVPPNAPPERVLEAIVKDAMSNYQYALGYQEETSIDAVMNFLFTTKEGDCTEFSNAVALLLRLRRIPTRVVVGYLASRDLQTASHRRGVANLKERIPALKETEINNLLLVTTAHRHSWLQGYFPSLGWVDIEATSFAIPPPPGMGPNDQRVVIPELSETPEIIASKEFRFPWILMGQLITLLALIIVLSLYAYRYGREVHLSIIAKGSNVRALTAREKLLWIAFANNGKPLKKKGETPYEYFQRTLIKEVNNFSGLYSRLRYDSTLDEEGKRCGANALADVTKKTILKNRDNTIKGFFRRLFSLRSLKC